MSHLCEVVAGAERSRRTPAGVGIAWTMASPELRLPTNVAGPLYVDASCIDCATCRWMAPESFDYQAGASRVHRQPVGAEAAERALAALVACPTASIGTEGPLPAGPRVAEVARSFPRPIEAGSPVLHCGYHSEDSYGAASWLVLRPEGNILVDSPRFARPLVRRLEALGGVSLMFLTHRDDVADHARFAAHFGCRRAMHRADQGPGTRDLEVVLEGPEELAPGARFLPTPGHTRGSGCLLVDQTWLFTGDTLCWSATSRRLHAFRRACWDDWDVLRRSVASLEAETFEWVLPGHGAPVKLPPGSALAELQRLGAWMAEVA